MYCREKFVGPCKPINKSLFRNKKLLLDKKLQRYIHQNLPIFFLEYEYLFFILSLCATTTFYIPLLILPWNMLIETSEFIEEKINSVSKYIINMSFHIPKIWQIFNLELFNPLINYFRKVFVLLYYGR